MNDTTWHVSKMRVDFSFITKKYQLTHSCEKNFKTIVTVVISYRAIILSKVLGVTSMNYQRRFYAVSCGILDDCVIIIFTCINFPPIMWPENVFYLRYGEGSTFNLYGLTGLTKLLLRRGDWWCSFKIDWGLRFNGDSHDTRPTRISTNMIIRYG